MEDNLDVDIFSLCEKATINRLVTSRAHHKGFTEDDCTVNVRMVTPKVSCDTRIGAWGVPEPPNWREPVVPVTCLDVHVHVPVDTYESCSVPIKSAMRADSRIFKP